MSKREQILSRFETKQELFDVFVTLPDLDSVYSVCEELEETGMKFKGWLKVGTNFKLIVSSRS